MSDTGDKYDVVVIGGGTGGRTAAARGAQLGLKVALVERHVPDGVYADRNRTLNIKLLETASLLAMMRNSADMGITCGDISADWDEVIRRARKVIEEDRTNATAQLKELGVEIIDGTGSFESLGQIKVVSGGGERILETRNVILATGVRQNTPPGMEFNGKQILSLSDAFPLEERPRRLLIVGSGVEAVEFAYLYANMGCDVSIVGSSAQIVPGMGDDINEAISQSLISAGVKLYLNSRVGEVTSEGAAWTYKISGAASAEIVAEVCLITEGIQGNIEALNSKLVGLEVIDGFIPVNRYGRTTVPGVWAVGNCSGGAFQAHAAKHEGTCVAETIANLPNPGISYDNIPACIYSNPQVAIIGMNEAAAAEAGKDFKVGKAYFDGGGFVKFIVGKQYHEVLGVQIVGHGAPDLIAEIALGRLLEVSAREFATSMHAHPSLSETVMRAAAEAMVE